MKQEHDIPEPYASHLKQLWADLAQAEAGRNAALARAYELERAIQSLKEHVSSLVKLQAQALDLPQQDGYTVTSDCRIITGLVNGVAH